MILYVAAQCWDYELRLSWMISSLLQQRRVVNCRLMLDVATLGPHPYQYPAFGPLAPEVASPHYHVSLQYYDTPADVFARRGITRNTQALRAREAGADWVWWADADHVYPPEFLLHVTKWCRHNRRAVGCMTATHKLHARADDAQALVEGEANNIYHAHAYEKAIGCRMHYKVERGVAGGCMQVVNRRLMDSLGWLYVDPAKCRDRHLFRRGQMARSDLQFRSRAGSTINVDLPLQIHLDHKRDKEQEPKRHIEGCQR